MQHKLVFIETQDVVETTLAFDNYRKACDCGRGAIFFSVASMARSCPSPLQPAVLLGAPSFPNAIAWSDENLIAVASGHLVTILRPDLPVGGPRGVIKIFPSQPLCVGLVERQDLLSGCLLPTALYRDDKPVVRSISWSPLGMAANSGCLIAVCTSEGHVKIYRPPFCDYCAEWIEVVDITKRLYENLKCTEFRCIGIATLDKNASDQMDSLYKHNGKLLKEKPENHSPLISADQYASRSAMLCSLVVSWSPLLHLASEYYPVCDSFSLLAVGGKSGKISLWRFHPPVCYTIDDKDIPTTVKFAGLLHAHNSWVTTISWLLFDFDPSNPQILLVSGSSDGSVKIWLADNDKLLKLSKMDQTSFSLLKEVMTLNAVPVSVLSVTVHVQYPSKILLAIGKVSGSFEIWLFDISSREFDKLGSYYAHDYVVTGLTWAFGGRFLYSCSQDNLVQSWILRENHLDEVTLNSDMPRDSSINISRDAFDSCFGVAVSPGNLVIATVHCFDVEKLNRMYEGRVLRAAIDYFWIGGLQMEVQLKSPFSCCIEGNSSYLEKELIYWGTNIIWSLNQYQCHDKPLVLWDIITALLAFKDHNSKYAEHIIIKWIASSFLQLDMDLPSEKVLSFVCSRFSEIPCRLLHLFNIICRRVILAELDADQITGLTRKVEKLERVCPAMEKDITKWTEILLSSERELRKRLVGFSFSIFRTSMSNPETSSQHGCWYPVGLAQMEQWIASDQKHLGDQLKAIVSEVSQKKRFLANRCSAVETCSFCSASVPFESPEFGFCQCENSSDDVKPHRLLRCVVCMQVCPITPLWYCVCCHRAGFRLAPEPLFRMSSFHVDSESFIKSSSQAVSSKPFCPFCGILLQRQQPDFLLCPRPV
ncbi:uncharacterized protein LOC106771179 isoform X3 [Vigna radiata var. radiata]|uniref:Uncharacterized protein LOC106771179 isoform X3 n=1 Tax=Vigna radiata var. radiata TaxID=3916 RepID=A0A3Q0FIM2_VIGRR|nr:uncharacterized protein LOC106771179 isoform X3 [Vigna radiata var. radiata]XP_022642524.1 uncharacterized protein LOC106771179 isoform X3 [Vigna radiata var. radiata]XP_022642531.1 uncharacterized protein LOC106771179 isoform X3 [Vigna radiata var. radiata]